MSFKKLITLTQDQYDFISHNERTKGIKPFKFIRKAIDFYIKFLMENEEWLRKRRQEQEVEKINLKK
jgi:AAA15 family ATPase/GTPase